MVGTLVDIHESKLLQQRLEEERAMLAAVLENLPVGACVAKPGGELTVINKKLVEIWGGVQSQSKSAAEYGEWRGYHPDGRRYAGTDWPLARSLNGEVVVEEETVIERCDGRRAIATISSHPVYNSTGEIIAGVVTVTDVTELRRMQEAEGRRIAAEKVAEATRSLISNCSHELRTVRWAHGGDRV
jgi:PAS domain S-box-containing protein